MIMPCALTNGGMGYFPMMSAYDEGGYEARASRFKAGVAEVIIENGKKLLDEIKLDYSADSEGNFSLSLNGSFLKDELVTLEVNANVSYFAAIVAVREKLKTLQRSLAEKQRIVMEGRDIGSVVFPDAQWKFFVTASPEVRARRRLDQSKESYSSATLEEIAKSIAERDRIDSERPVAPLKQCEDAVLVDSSNMNVEETVAFIAERIR